MQVGAGYLDSIRKGLSLTENYAGATRLSGRISEGFLRRRSQNLRSGTGSLFAKLEKPVPSRPQIQIGGSLPVAQAGFFHGIQHSRGATDCILAPCSATTGSRGSFVG